MSRLAEDGAATSIVMRRQMLQDVDLRGRRLDVDGLMTSVLDGGEGPALVLVHGGIECGGVMWTPVVAGLAEHHRVVIADVPGLGESVPAARLDQARFDAWFAELLRLTCPHAPTVVAHSLLGTLAARFAAAHGDLLGRLVVYAAPGVGPYRMPPRLRRIAVRFAVRPTERNSERFERFALLDRDATRSRDAVWYDAFSGYSLARARTRDVRATMRRLIRAGTTAVADDELRSIAVPVDLLWGRHDRMVPLPLGEEASSRLGWPLHIIEGAAHAPHIEQPEAFVSTLLDVIRPPVPRRST
jgi:pimeloyl-ACP methyl ester carboxylesterase